MRNFFNLGKHVQAKLSQQYTNLDRFYDEDDVEGYTPLSVSIFKHQLSEVEAYELLAGVKPEEQTRRNKKKQFII